MAERMDHQMRRLFVGKQSAEKLVEQGRRNVHPLVRMLTQQKTSKNHRPTTIGLSTCDYRARGINGKERNGKQS